MNTQSYTFQHLLNAKPVTTISDLSYDAAAHIAQVTSIIAGNTCLVVRAVGKDQDGFECIEVTRFVGGQKQSKNVVYAEE